MRCQTTHTHHRGVASAPWLHADADPDLTLAIQVHYIVLYDTDDNRTNVPLANIRDNHHLLNTCLQNTNNQTMVPTWFKGREGNPQISVLPVASTALQAAAITRVPLVAAQPRFSSLVDLQTYLRQHTAVPFAPGVLHVYIAPLRSPLLGAAELLGSSLVIDGGTVGSAAQPGYGDPRYNTGKTYVHEIGHVFGLWHPFASGDCQRAVLPDIPLQKEPNTEASIVLRNGRYVVHNDNRARDCQTPPSDRRRSCIDVIPAYDCAADDTPEGIHLFMSYSIDAYLLSFTRDQARATRLALLNSDLLAVTTSQANPPSILPALGERGSVGGGVTPLTLTLIASGLVAGFVLVGVVVYTIVVKKKKKRVGTNS
jgi:hypothetical protein